MDVKDSLKKKICIYDQYFNETLHYTEQYGENVIVLMQVGSFFEMYGYKENDEIKGSRIEQVSNHCGFSISEKKNLYNDNPLVMAGVPEYSIDKHVPLIIGLGYTVVVFKQVDIDNSDKKKRVLENIYSPGTCIPQDDTRVLSNNIMCIWVELHPKIINNTSNTFILQYGASCIDMVCGDSVMIEHSYNVESKKMFPSNFDELHRFMSVYNPSETIIISSEKEDALQNIIDMTNVNSRLVHILNPTESVKVDRCEKQVYQQEILEEYFNVNTYDICQEFRENMLATQSYCYLLNFIKEHNPKLVKNINLPSFKLLSDRVILANHTLSQLNIIEDNENKSSLRGKKGCVSSFLNKCCTAMGKRKFKTEMTNPTTNEEWLNNEYRMIQHMLDNYSDDRHQEIRKHLCKIKDVERIVRQIFLRKLYPSTMYHLYINIEEMLLCLESIKNDTVLLKYIWSDAVNVDDEDIYNDMVNVLIAEKKHLDSVLNISNCAYVSSMKNVVETPIIKNEVDKDYDHVMNTYHGYESRFVEIKDYLETCIKESEKKKIDSGYIKVHKTDKTGKYLDITTPRCKKLQESMKSHEEMNINEYKPILLSDIKFVTGNGNNKRIDAQQLNSITRSILEYEGNIQKETTRVYNDIMNDIELEHCDNLDKISKLITKLDVLQSKSYVANEYNYSKPEIQVNTESFVHAYGLRHVLIEHIQQNETYVPNNLFINKSLNDRDVDNYTQGILLYGTNAVGKTSLIRALGISVIMAQCGMFVPCSKFVYKPYNGIYSRILGNDNLFRGLSTFAVEMSELRVILNESCKNSLILGDELCSGTEIQSALSIFVSGLEKMYNNKSSFIFATHFHDIIQYDEIKQMNHLGIKHMEVVYNRQSDSLIYDRKIKDGPGTKTYGLEVCKSLHLDNEFLKRAYEIRNKYFKETSGALGYGVSRYNSKKVLGLCEMCNIEMGVEVHHIEHQKNANNNNGYIGNIHKDHKANLMNICEKCHYEIHHNPETSIKKKKTLDGAIILT